jgi:hypothetical protein
MPAQKQARSKRGAGQTAWRSMEPGMSLEFLLVDYPPGQRAVLADGDKVGFTNHTLMLPANEYTITLDGDPPTTPPSADVVLAGTSIMKPKVVSFA